MCLISGTGGRLGVTQIEKLKRSRENAAGGSPGGAVRAAGEGCMLRAEIVRLKEDLVEERKKQKKGGEGGQADGGQGRPEPRQPAPGGQSGPSG